MSSVYVKVSIMAMMQYIQIVFTVLCRNNLKPPEMVVPWSSCNSTCLCVGVCMCETGFCFTAQRSQHGLGEIQAAGNPDCSCISLHKTDADFFLESLHMCLCLCAHVSVCVFVCVHVQWPLTVQSLFCWPDSLDKKAVILAKTLPPTPPCTYAPETHANWDGHRIIHTSHSLFPLFLSVCWRIW